MNLQIPNFTASRTIIEMDAHDGIRAELPMELPAQITNSTNRMYDAWWRAQFANGRVDMVTIKVVDTT